MRLRVWWVALGLAIAVAPAKAQEQKTLGPCSPAIAGVSGNVAVTCLTSNQRIRIASFTGNIAAWFKQVYVLQFRSNYIPGRSIH